MTFTVSYYCPHCETMVDLERDEYLADKAVTPFPFEGWEYVAPDEAFEAADGVRFVCGESDAQGLNWRANPWTETPAGGHEEETAAESTGAEDDLGCGEPFYLSFVKFADGEELDPRAPLEHVRLAEGQGTKSPRGPTFGW
jgi:hypothetical protein